MRPRDGESAREYVYRLYQKPRLREVSEAWWCRHCWTLVHADKRIEHHRDRHSRLLS
jgi:hypothetical protein